jgi:amino acid adenylation domain-containing protein
MKNIAEWIDSGVYKWPDRLALITNERRVTYKELWKDCNYFANSIIKLGLKKGDKVCIHFENCYEAVVSIIGTIKAGGVFVCIAPGTPEEKLNDIIVDSNAAFFISDKKPLINLQLKHKISTIVDNNSLSDTWSCYYDLLEPSTEVNISKHFDIASIIYTSGSTGKPKGIVSSNNNIIFSTKAINGYLQNNKNDKVLSYLPLSFDYGLYQLFLVLSEGGTLYLRRSKMFAGEINKIIQKEEITGLPGLRSIFGFLLRNKKGKHIDFPSVRYLTNTGDSLTQNMIERMRKSFSNSKIFLMYGLTECKRVSFLPPKDLERKPTSIGIPLEGTKVEIINNKNKQCSPFEIGELQVSGPHVCEGYWNNEEESKKVFIEKENKKVLKTGDLCYQDEEGYLYYIGRKDEMFKSKGYRIEPQEIETILQNEFSEVKEIVVVGIPDEIAGKKVAFFVVNESGELDNKELAKKMKDFCERSFEPWKRPEYIRFSDNMPLTLSGKINRKKIIDLIINQEEEIKC